MKNIPENIKIRSILKALIDQERNAEIEAAHAFYVARWYIIHHYPELAHEFGETVDNQLNKENRNE